MLCAEFVETQDGAYLRATQRQPPDVADCQLVILQGSDTAYFSVFKIPTPTEFGAAWAWGFSIVVVSYLAGWAVGAVLNFLNRS